MHYTTSGPYSSDGSQASTNGPSLGDSSAGEDIVDSARSGRDEFDFGDDRAIMDPPNWHSQESTQLYHGAITNNDPGSVDATGHAWMEHGRELEQVATDLYNAITELGAAWIGQAAGAAQGALVGIANSSGIAGEAARTMGKRMVEQSAAAAEVKKMPCPVEFNSDQAMSALLAGGPAAMTADMKAQSDRARDVKAAQVAYFQAYTAAMESVDGSTPSFGPESLGLRPMAGSGGSGGPSAGGYDMTGGGVGDGGPGLAAARGGVDLAASGTDAGAGSPAGSGAPAAAEGGSHAAPAAPTQSGPVNLTGSAPISATSSGPGIGATAGAAALGAGLGVAGARALAKGSRFGSKKNDATTASSDPAAAQGAQGTAPGGQAGQHVAPPGGPIGAAPPPATPMTGAPAGAGAGSAQEDEEHTHNSFLIEPDPDELFGAGEATAPPVIGLSDED